MCTKTSGVYKAATKWPDMKHFGGSEVSLRFPGGRSELEVVERRCIWAGVVEHISQRKL